jgi:hypothetical protein
VRTHPITTTSCPAGSRASNSFILIRLLNIICDLTVPEGRSDRAAKIMATPQTDEIRCPYRFNRCSEFCLERALSCKKIHYVNLPRKHHADCILW